MKRIAAAIVGASLTFGCAAPPPSDIQHPAHGLGVALGYLVASPVLILAGLAEGIATAPYFVDADLHEMDRVMTMSDAQVSIGRTYEYAYQTPLDMVPPSGDTGQVFRHMRPATHHFQNVLQGYGVDSPENYILTAVRTADRDGYTLYGIVYRTNSSIRVKDASGRIRVLTPNDDEFYRPYARDARGQPLDMIIDWAGVPRTSIRTQKGQAVLMTLAANSVVINRRSDDYWAVEKRWMAGGFKSVVAERKAVLDRRMS
ncbi:MAG: hypothetical protein ACTSVG_05340 [Alphaproteobacteria bacterium]